MSTADCIPISGTGLKHFVPSGFAYTLTGSRPGDLSWKLLLGEGQWANALVPHILFQAQHFQDYFPGPFRLANSEPMKNDGRSSFPQVAISKPPVAGLNSFLVSAAGWRIMTARLCCLKADALHRLRTITARCFRTAFSVWLRHFPGDRGWTRQLP